MSSSLRSLAAAVALAVAALPAWAQKNKNQGPPARPRLEANADTNDAAAYYAYGLKQIHDKGAWKNAYDAFWWANRLEPQNPANMLAIKEALWYKQSPEWRDEYNLGAEYVLRSKEARQIDSLVNEVRLRNPFSHLYSTVCWLDEYIDQLDDEVLKGYAHASNYCLPRAIDAWGKALAKNPKLLSLRVERARLFFFEQQYDSTLAELNTVLGELRARDQKQLLHSYESKEMLEYMVGLADLAKDDYDAAREAFGRALAENLSFPYAHAALARLALARSDWATAANEYELAVQLKADDPNLFFDYGFALLQAQPRRNADAEARFRKAIELNPDFALAYYDLAVTLDNQGKKAEAIEQYNRYIARAPRRLSKTVNFARQRVAALTGGT